jgi:hypothetical protein
VSQNTDLGNAVLGVAGVRERPALINSLPDIGDANQVTDAQNQYKAQHDAWAQANTMGAYFAEQEHIQHMQASGASSDDITKELARFTNLKMNEPKPPDILAIQKQQDRDRLLSLGKNVYDPLMASQLAMATGTGPSAALATYQTAADNAQRRAYGMAASSNMTGGQRASLFQAALGNAALGQQAAGNDAAKLRIQEMSTAGSNLANTAAGVAHIYGAPNLITDTQNTEGTNVGAENKATADNASHAEEDATNRSKAIGGYFDAAGHWISG